MGTERDDLEKLPKKAGIEVRRIMMVGATEHGQHVGIEFETVANEQAMLLIPFGQFQRLMLGLMTAGALAHKDQVTRAGSEENALAVAGFSAFQPTGYDVGKGRTVEGQDIVLMRFKKGSLPIIDITLPPADAESLGKDIFAELEKKDHKRRPTN